MFPALVWLNCLLYESPLAAVTKYQRLSGLNARNVLSHSSRSKRSDIKVSTGHVPSETWRGYFLAFS